MVAGSCTSGAAQETVISSEERPLAGNPRGQGTCFWRIRSHADRNSAIIHDFARKSSFFMSLGAGRLKRRMLVLVLGIVASLSFTFCGSGGAKIPPSGLSNRVMASQSVSSVLTFGELVIINGQNDTVPRVAPIQAGVSPGLMAITPSRNIVSVFDSGTNSVYSVNTVTEQSIGKVQLPGPTSSMALPTANPVGYAAVPTAFVNGYSFLGAVEEMNLAGSIAITMGVTNAQTVVSNASGSQLLVFSSGLDTVTVLKPANAVPPVDTSCFNTPPLQPPPNSVCSVVSGFDRPVNAIINENTAYILNCGAECGGTQASVMILDLETLNITNVIPVDGATMGYLIGSTLYVAGTSPTNNACTGETTAATTCGRLDTIDLNSNTVTSSTVITDGYHTNLDMSINGQLFIGSINCTEIGNSNNNNPSSGTPTGEVRGCLSILNTNTGALVLPPENGDVNGLQSFTTREVEYVAQGGYLYVYDTIFDALLINDIITNGTIDITGYIGDVKAVDFF
jgi:hypothetical protein